MQFSVVDVEWINVDVFDGYQVMADECLPFERRSKTYGDTIMIGPIKYYLHIKGLLRFSETFEELTVVC